MIENFFTKLSEGDVRSFVTLCLLALVFYLLIKAILDVYKKGEGFFKVLKWALIFLVVYGWFVFPETVTVWFYGVVDFITGLIEPLFESYPG